MKFVFEISLVDCIQTISLNKQFKPEHTAPSLIDLKQKGPNSKTEALTLKAPITTAADDVQKYVFIDFQRK